jgi:hypothetical protein
MTLITFTRQIIYSLQLQIITNHQHIVQIIKILIQADFKITIFHIQAVHIAQISLNLIQKIF